MHIPDGFLSIPVWGTMDAVAAPSVVWMARRAQREFDHHKIPLMGVMGAFIFAAQMINFPVGSGTSGHLVGGALLSFTLGPAAASIVMTAILVIQALVFQDGGLLALGANVFNMAIAGVLAGYLPYLLLRGRRSGMFLGGTISVLTSAVLALAELCQSGVRMPGAVLAVTLGVFLISAIAEGAITLAVMQALERIEPGFARRPREVHARGAAFAVIGASLVLVCTGVFAASARPDWIVKLAGQQGIPMPARTLLASPAAAYFAGIAALFLIYLLCTGLSRALGRPGAAGDYAAPRAD